MRSASLSSGQGPDSTAGNLRFRPTFPVTNVLENRSPAKHKVSAVSPGGVWRGRTVGSQLLSPPRDQRGSTPAGAWVPHKGCAGLEARTVLGLHAGDLFGHQTLPYLRLVRGDTSTLRRSQGASTPPLLQACSDILGRAAALTSEDPVSSSYQSVSIGCRRT